MSTQLTEQQRAIRDRARKFAEEKISPWVSEIDQQQVTPVTVLDAIREAGYLGAALPCQWGGGGLDSISYGLMTEEIGKVCSSVRSLMTVHNMSSQAIARFGTPEQQSRWLPDLCSGRKIIAFALSEPNVGSAAHMIETTAEQSGSGYVLTGIKKWITYGQIADLFLVFARYNDKPSSFVVARDSAGLQVNNMRDIMGTRGSMLAELEFRDVSVHTGDQLGLPGMGISFVANTSLDHGRFSVAWGSVGIIQACLDACVTYTGQRKQGNKLLKDYQLVRRHLSDMLVSHTAARALCFRSADLRELGDPRAIMETSLAKYFASKAAIQVATDAVHLHGANGCSSEYPIGKYLRDAMVMGVIEGTHEYHQLTLASYAFQRPYLL